MEDVSGEEVLNMGSFNLEEASNSVKECIQSVMGEESYRQDSVNQWTAKIVEQALTLLVKQSKSFNKLCCHAEMWCWSAHSQLLLLGHNCRRELHSEVGEPDHVLCGQCVCCGLNVLVQDWHRFCVRGKVQFYKVSHFTDLTELDTQKE